MLSGHGQTVLPTKTSAWPTPLGEIALIERNSTSVEALSGSVIGYRLIAESDIGRVIRTPGSRGKRRARSILSPGQPQIVSNLDSLGKVPVRSEFLRISVHGFPGLSSYGVTP